MKITDQGFRLDKKDFDTFFLSLQRFGEVIAPTKKEAFTRMEKVDSPKEIVWEGVSWFTSKKYTFPQKQTLFKFKGEKIESWDENPTRRVLFGLRLCDLNAFYVNDQLFLNQEPQMHFYEKFRQNLLLVGLWCDKPQDDYCFCDSMDLQHRYDLCLFDKDDHFHIKCGSEKGQAFLEALDLQKDQYWKEAPKCKMKLNTTDIKDFFEKNEVWNKGVKDCLSCGDCTTLCPTCLCYDIEDESDLAGYCGERCAKWDSCMYKDFTLVAGGHHFRGYRTDRFKHRIYHKLQYFKEDFNESMCTGCGRCIRGCPTKIDWIALVNEMQQEKVTAGGSCGRGECECGGNGDSCGGSCGGNCQCKKP
jgi:sulfhydrogenase subunit beta (sulfur reductase)